MHSLFETVFYQPLFNLLIAIYNVLPSHDLGLTILILTLLVRIILVPLSWHQIRAQSEIQELQPLLAELKEKYKDDKQGFATAQMQLFQEKKINPLASCLPVLIQLPFLLGLFYVFQNGLESKDLQLLYSFVQRPETLNHTFLGLFSVTDKHNLILAVLVGASQFVQMKLMMPKQKKTENSEKKADDFSSILNTQMTYVMPLMIGYMSYTFPSGLGIYWFVQTVFITVQQLFFMRKMKKPLDTSSIPTTASIVK